MKKASDLPLYQKTLLQYFEEEVMGEAYFYGLIEHFDAPHEHEKLKLLAQIERYAVETVRPLLSAHKLTPRSDKELAVLGEGAIKRHQDLSWNEFMAYMVKRYPGYIDDFEGLEGMAPANDLPALKTLTDHEVAVIEFANREIAGTGDSLAPLKEYLAQENDHNQP